MSTINRENFGSRFAAIMAMAGSAIGLGNIWRFPYMVGEYGGAAFIILYLFAAVFLCIPIFICESIIGKRTQLSTFEALETLKPGTRWKWLGFLTVLTPLIILSYYSVVGGWSIDYLFRSLTFSFSNPETSQETHSMVFGNFITNAWKPLICHTVFIILNIVVVMYGIKGGIERFTKISTPVLFILIVSIMFYSLSLPGSGAGVTYLIKPDFSKITSEAVLSALGQAFFSLSLGVGCILTYASYIKREDNILSTGLLTIFFDLGFALIAGFAIMPAVFSAGIKPGAGPGLIFETLPYIFSSIAADAPVLSRIVAIVFFVTILIAALTSSISMLEVGVAFLVDHKQWNRKKATIVLALGCWALGALCSLSFGPMNNIHLFGNTIFNFCDKLTSNFLMTMGSLLFVIFTGWILKKEDIQDEFTNGGKLKLNSRIFGVMWFMIRYVAPITIAIVFVSTLVL